MNKNQPNITLKRDANYRDDFEWLLFLQASLA